MANRCMLSDAIPTPRGSVECRNNAQRGRQQGNWFCHEGAASSAPAQTHVPPMLPSHAAGLASTDIRSSDLSLRISSQRIPPGEDTQTWYKYGSDYKDEIIGQPSASRNTRGTMANGSEIKKKMTDCHSNNWFRHEHADGEEDPTDSEIEIRGKKHPKSTLSSESPNSPLWAMNGEDEAAKRPAPRRETEEYMRKYKSDMSSGWFAHGGDDITGTSPSSHFKGSKESAENAAKIKGGSTQNWFSHDSNENYVEPKPAIKLTSPEAKLLMEKSRGDDMKLLFRMDQNSNST